MGVAHVDKVTVPGRSRVGVKNDETVQGLGLKEGDHIKVFPNRATSKEARAQYNLNQAAKKNSEARSRKYEHLMAKEVRKEVLGVKTWLRMGMLYFSSRI